MELLGALETIRNASDASLHSHAEQTILTLQRISQRLRNLSPGFQATPLDPGSVPSPPQSPRNFQFVETATPREQAGGSGPTPPQPLQAAGFGDYNTFPGEPPSEPYPQYSPQSFQAAETTTLGDEAVLASPQTPHVHGLEVPLTLPAAQSIPARDSSGSAQPGSIRASPDHIIQLLKCVKKSTRLIWEQALRDSSSDLLSRKRNSGEDARLAHIRCIEGDKSLGNKEKLLRVLALRSIALEFTKKQQDDGVSPTRLHELYQHTLPPKVPNSSRASIFNIGNKDFLAKSLAAGLKYMVFEKVIAAHCHDEQNLASICAAISAIVGLNIDQFRRFRYDEMRCFAQKLISDDKYIQLSDQKMRLLDAVRSLSPWFNEVQNDYNLIFQSPVSGMESSRRKYPRTDLDSTPDIMDNFIECPISIPQDSVPLDLGFENTDIPRNGVDTQSLDVVTEDEFADQFYEQISNQPIDVSGIMDDIANRSYFDFEHIALYNVAITSPETAGISTG